MLKDIKWPRHLYYKSESDWEPFEFYLSALTESKSLDLFLGYFSSAAINVLSLGFAKFLASGGSLRLVVNDVLSAEDRNVIQHIDDGYLYQIPFDIENFGELRSRLDDYDLHFFNCLGWLIQNNRIEIVPIRPLNKRGTAHYKTGIFSDGKDKVSFNGSCNFTLYGLLENFEKIDVTLSWESNFARDRIISDEDEFNRVFEKKADYVEYLSAEQIKKAIATTFGTTEIDELLVREAELVARKKAAFQQKKIRKILDNSQKRIENQLDAPRFPYPEGPRPYQMEAYENWIVNGYKGLFAMATGTGKTLTALNCLLNIYQETGIFRAVILVPTIALVQQWKNECLKFHYDHIITVSSKENWDQNISFFNTASRFIDASFIVIVTYASFQKKKFQSRFQDLPNDTLIIADEVHNMGSPSMLKLLPKIHLELRIGLSATPSRKYDIVGNESIEQFFNSRPPYTYSYSMKKALDSRWLCKYSYYPHVVNLTPDELDQYLYYSRQLLKYFDPATKSYKNTKEVEYLLLARKRVIHKAVNKKDVFKQILADEFGIRGNLQYTLVYVPEGIDTDYDQSDDEIDTEEDISLIDEYTRTVSRTDPGIMVSKYTSQTKSRESVIKGFEQGTIHVLTSMKCLDEGVDVPRSELAIFCASTGNPRQFIQRRGRVLRLHKDKTNAVIHDLVVVPLIADNDSTFEMERKLVSKELERVVDFADLSMNKTDTYIALKDVLDYYNLNLNDFSKETEE
jgi:superfamily II DNA or RNA helicase